MTPVELLTRRLRLEPLTGSHAGPMLGVLSDARLYAFTGERPPSLDELQDRYRRQVRGAPPGSEEEWLNWIMRLRSDGSPVGFVQATIADGWADVAWLVGVPWQGQGLATEAAAAMRDWLGSAGVVGFRAHIHPDHIASQRVARSVGLGRTGKLDGDGEEIWSSGRPSSKERGP